MHLTLVGKIYIAFVSPLRSNKRAAYTAAASPSAASQGHQEGQAKVKFNFHAQTPMELSLVKGT